MLASASLLSTDCCDTEALSAVAVVAVAVAVVDAAVVVAVPVPDCVCDVVVVVLRAVPGCDCCDLEFGFPLSMSTPIKSASAISGMIRGEASGESMFSLSVSDPP